MGDKNVSAIKLILGLIVLFELVYCFWWMPIDNMKALIVEEQACVARVFGDDDTNVIYERADNIYRTLVIDSGLRKALVEKKIREDAFLATCKSSKDHSKPRNEVDTSLKSPV